MLYVNPQVQSGFKDFRLSPGADRREAEALKEFERLFLFQMLKEMRKTVPDSGLFDGGMKREYFEEMMDDVVAGEMAESGQLGIARQMAIDLHAKQANINPDGLRAAGAGAGIPLATRSAAGFPLQKGDNPAIPINKELPAIPIEKPAVPGIPRARAHERYREQE